MSPIQVWEKIIQSLDPAEFRLIHLAAEASLVKLVKSQDMVPSSSFGIGPGGPRLHEKSPITRLSQQQLPGHLPEATLDDFLSRRTMESRTLSHPPGGGVQMRVDPTVLII